MFCRTQSRNWTFSPNASAIISWTPWRASSTVMISFARFKYFAASASIPELKPKTYRASGSNPASLAICAFVFRFCLYGKYRSSSSCMLSAWLILAFNVAVNFPCSSILLIISALRFSILATWSYVFWISRSWTSSRLPVISFRYRAINGTVFPSSSNFNVSLIWCGRNCGSWCAVISRYCCSIFLLL